MEKIVAYFLFLCSEELSSFLPRFIKIAIEGGARDPKRRTDFLNILFPVYLTIHVGGVSMIFMSARATRSCSGAASSLYEAANNATIFSAMRGAHYA
jgi:hypothetical protein